MTTTIPAGWKPIESAPKDGTSVLAWGPKQDRVVIAWNEWALPEAEWQAVGLGVNGFECPSIVLRGEPTLWQPLPAAPSAEQDATCNSAGERDAWFAGIEAGQDSARHNAVIRSHTGGSALLCAARAVVAADDAQALTSQLINELRAECDAAHAPTAGDTLDDFASAGDNTLHGAIDYWQARALNAEAALAAGDAQTAAARDAAFEEVRKRLCAIPRYSFCLDDDGVVRRVEDRSGNWIEFDAAHELFDPVCVDAAIAAQRQGDA